MPARLARGITGGSSARGWGVWQSFFVGRHFTGRESSKVSVRPCARPCRRSSRPSVSPVGRSRSSRSQVEAWPSSSAWPSQIALVISTDTEDANGEIEDGTASPPHLSRRPWLSSARASPSRTRERLDGRTTRPASSRSRRIRPTSASDRTDAESTAEVCERVLRRSTRRFGRGGGECGILLSHDTLRKKYFHPSRLRKHPAEGAICVCTF